MAMFTAEKLYGMKLGEEYNCGFMIVRVPGGWIFAQGNGASAVFVPFDNEFMKDMEEDDIRRSPGDI